jgi:hypothetical protein
MSLIESIARIKKTEKLVFDRTASENFDDKNSNNYSSELNLTGENFEILDSILYGSRSKYNSTSYFSNPKQICYFPCFLGQLSS